MATQTSSSSDQAATEMAPADNLIVRPAAAKKAASKKAVAKKASTKKAATKKAVAKKAVAKKAVAKKTATKKAVAKKAPAKKAGAKTNGSKAPAAKKASKQASKNGSNGVGTSHRSSYAGKQAGKTEASEKMAQLLRKAETGINTAGRVAQQSATYAAAHLSDIGAKVKKKTLVATKKAEGWAKDHPVLASTAATAVATVAGALVMKKFKPKVAAGALAGAGLLLSKLRGK